METSIGQHRRGCRILFPWLGWTCPLPVLWKTRPGESLLMMASSESSTHASSQPLCARLFNTPSTLQATLLVFLLCRINRTSRTVVLLQPIHWLGHPTLTVIYLCCEEITYVGSNYQKNLCLVLKTKSPVVNSHPWTISILYIARSNETVRIQYTINTIKTS